MVNLDPETGGPFQRLLMPQMQQNTMLVTNLLGEQAALTPLHALQELGIPSEKEDSSLLRKYFERRVPLADQSDFGRVGSSSGGRQCSDWFPWTSAFFVEQTALDGGRLERSWLLTGFTEPNAQFHFSIKKTPGLKPFSS